MATKGSDDIGSAAARNRRIIYILCGLTVVLSVVAVLVLLKEPATRQSSPITAENPPPDRGDSPPNPAAKGRTEDEPGTPRIEPRPVSPKLVARQEANALFDAGIVELQTAMKSSPGADETEELKKKALATLLKAQEAYFAYLEEYPEEEPSLDHRMTDLNQQIYWLRKGMAASSFATTGRESEPRPESSRPVEPRPATPRVQPEPTFEPEVAAAKFKAGAARALKEGRPDRIIELGAPLLEDPRMKDHLDEIPRYVALAKDMQAVLTAAEQSLMPQVGGNITLALRDRVISGQLRAVDQGIMVEGADGVETIHVGSLAAEEIARRAEAAEALTTPRARFAAGAYFALRGDHEEGARQLILARGGGEDISEYSPVIERALHESAELRALDRWVDLEPRLAAPSPELFAALDIFKSDHWQTKLFAEHREEIFSALGAAGETLEFDLADLYGVLDRVSGKSVKLAYTFDDGDEFMDFGSQEGWTVADGVLTGTKGVAWLERFDLRSADFRFVLKSAAEMKAVLYEGGWDLGGGLTVSLKPDPTGLVVAFANGRKRLGQEVVRMPKGPVEIHLRLKGDKFQLAVNRKVILKGDGAERPEPKHPRVLVLQVAKEPVEFDEIELKADLDMDWAKAGGTHYAHFIRDYHVTGPFTLSKWQLQVALEHTEWPEVEPFDLGKLAGNGEPCWTYVRPKDNRLDLNRLKPSDRIFAYAVVRVWSPDRRTAILEVSADDAAKAWLNDELVMEMVPLGEPQRVNVKLNPGENLLLLKVADEKQAFWLQSRLLTKNGERMPDVVCW